MNNRKDLEEESKTPLLHSDVLQIQSCTPVDTSINSTDHGSSDSGSIALNSPIGLCNAPVVLDDDDESIITCTGDEEELLCMQATVLFEDAINYRSIHHKMDRFSIRLYRWYHSIHVLWSINSTTYILLLLAFFEYPSSLTWSSDPRVGGKRYVCCMCFRKSLCIEWNII